MMNFFRQHIPRFISGFKEAEFVFESLSELLDTDILKGFSTSKGFSYFAKSDQNIIAIMNEGFSWWVVGNVAYPDELDLPKWDGGRYLIEYNEKVIEIPVKFVNASRAGEVLINKKWFKSGNYKDYIIQQGV